MLVAAAIAIIAAFAAHAITFAQLERNPVPIAVYAQTFSYLPLLAYLGWIVPRTTGYNWNDLGFQRPSAQTLGWAILGAILLVLLVDAGGALYDSIYHLHAETATSFVSTSHGPLYLPVFIIMAVICAPLTEEIAFRSILFSALRSRLPIVPAAGLSGIAFGAAHVSLGSFLPLALGGFLLALIYARTKNLWSTIIAHALFNCVGVALAFAGLNT